MSERIKSEAKKIERQLERTYPTDGRPEVRIYIPDDGRNPRSPFPRSRAVVLYDPDRYPGGGPRDDLPSPA